MAQKITICGLTIPRPLQRHLVVSLSTFSIFLLGFLLFLLVGLSLPITPSIYIIEVSALNSTTPISNAATNLYFGVWGVCATGPLVTAPNFCYGPQLGYTIPAKLLSGAGLSTQLGTIAEKGLLVILALHLVAASLSTMFFVLSLFMHSHKVAIIALISAIVTALIGTVVFAVDVVLVTAVKNHINALFSGASFRVTYGNAVWMIMVAMTLTWVAVVILSARVCYCCGVRRPPPETEKALLEAVADEQNEQAVMS